MLYEGLVKYLSLSFCISSGKSDAKFLNEVACVVKTPFLANLLSSLLGIFNEECGGSESLRSEVSIAVMSLLMILDASDEEFTFRTSERKHS